jgi:radical SAM superfamily enzyme YgiQ (UPF0313 family)
MAKSLRKTFHLVMIKPSHYDDDGYVIQWVKSVMPSNTLATLYGLGLDCAERRVLGDDVDIELTGYDETNTRIRPEKIASMIRDAGGLGLVGLIGVQSNQYPRALDIARRFRELDIPVCIGGFHVSGCLAMLPEITPDLQEALDMGVTLFAGEAEGRLETLLQDAYHGRMPPTYNYLNDLPTLPGSPVPFLPADRIARTIGRQTTLDAGRGCPFLCSFCTIINVQGRKSRSRSVGDIEKLVRVNLAQGIRSFFITDDNFARNQDWESIFDRMIQLREEEGLPIKFIIQVDTMCHKIPGFMEKSRRAGVTRVFIGMESINPDALKGAGKGQNRITEYRVMLQAWQQAGVTTYAGYILGFPTDTPETIVRDIEIIQRELPVDLLEFFILTPLPGSADHKKLYEEGVPLALDLNNYDTVHVAMEHPKMSESEWYRAYHLAWETYYSLSHVETLLRRAKRRGFNVRNMKMKVLSFYGLYKFEGLHPLEGGLFRRKYRRDRRPGLPVENPLLFYTRFAWEMTSKYSRILWAAWQFARICRRVERDDAPYTDLALTPVDGDELDALAIFNATDAAKAAMQKKKRRQKSREQIA